MIFLRMWPGAEKWALRLTRRDELTIVLVNLDVGQERFGRRHSRAERGSECNCHVIYSHVQKHITKWIATCLFHMAKVIEGLEKDS